MRALFLLYFVFLMIGCSSITYHEVEIHDETVKMIPIYLDKDFVGEEVKEIEVAVDLWNRTFNKQLVLFVADVNFDMSDYKINEVRASGGFIIFRLNSIQANERGEVESNILAYANKVGGDKIYLIRDRFGIGDLHYIVMHELGHLMGAEHTERGLMYKFYYASTYVCIDYLAVRQVAAFEKLNMDSMNYCIR